MKKQVRRKEINNEIKSSSICVPN